MHPWEEDDFDEITEYTGSPKNPDAFGETTKWRSFLSFIGRYLISLARRGDSYLTAKVETIEAEVALKQAQTVDIIEQAKKKAIETAEKADKLSFEKSQRIKDFSNDQKNEERKRLEEEIEEKLERYRLLYGLRILPKQEKEDKEI